MPSTAEDEESQEFEHEYKVLKTDHYYEMVNSFKHLLLTNLEFYLAKHVSIKQHEATLVIILNFMYDH